MMNRLTARSQRARVSSCARLLFAVSLLPALGSGMARAGTGMEPGCSPMRAMPTSLWAAADFDGDQTVDLARVRVSHTGTGFTATGVHFVADCRTPGRFDFLASRHIGLVLSARDLDADQDQDLVLRDRFAGKALGVWLNDGKGGFVETEPSSLPGADSDGAGLHAPALDRHSVAAATFSRVHASVSRGPRLIRFAPRSVRRVARAAAFVHSGLRSAHANRGPPHSC